MAETLIDKLRDALDETERIVREAQNPPLDEGGAYYPDHYIGDSEERFASRFTADAMAKLVAAHRKLLRAHPISTMQRHDGTMLYACRCWLDDEGDPMYSPGIDCFIIPVLAEGYDITVEEPADATS